MPFVAANLVATVGSPTANSYITLAAFTAANERELVSAAVTAATDVTAARALVQATARLDEERYIGTRASDTQALEWPRVNAIDVYGFTWPDNAIPRPVDRATTLLARYYLERRAADIDGDAASPDDATRVKKLQAGDVSVEFRDAVTANGSAASPYGGDIPESVLRALLGLVLTPADLAALLARGVGSFDFYRA